RAALVMMPTPAERRHRRRPDRPAQETDHMRWTRILTAFLVFVLFEAGAASAQTVLRIGLNDDPDALDPTISRAYVGRLVFAAFCDKLFDVTPEIKIVPQLA